MALLPREERCPQCKENPGRNCWRCDYEESIDEEEEVEDTKGMVHSTRLFTVDELKELDVPHDMVAEEIRDQSRWETFHTGVFLEPSSGKHYEIDWAEGSTEYQENDYWGGEDTVLATEVELREVTIKKWVPVNE